MKLKDISRATSAKIAAGTAILLTAVPALADDPFAGAVAELESLKGGVSSIGAVIVGIAVLIVGFVVARRMVNKV